MLLTVVLAVSDAERALGRMIRHAVFVTEQGVPPELEADGLDEACEQFLVYRGSEAVATARLRHTADGVKLERVAVLESHRRQAIGRTLVREVLKRLVPAEVGGDARLYVHAQNAALEFWRREGFIVEGNEFFEAGIPHRTMVWSCARPAAGSAQT